MVLGQDRSETKKFGLGLARALSIWGITNNIVFEVFNVDAKTQG